MNENKFYLFRGDILTSIKTDGSKASGTHLFTKKETTFTFDNFKKYSQELDEEDQKLCEIPLSDFDEYLVLLNQFKRKYN